VSLRFPWKKGLDPLFRPIHQPSFYAKACRCPSFSVITSMKPAYHPVPFCPPLASRPGSEYPSSPFFFCALRFSLRLPSSHSRPPCLHNVEASPLNLSFFPRLSPRAFFSSSTSLNGVRVRFFLPLFRPFVLPHSSVTIFARPHLHEPPQ